jgi:catechol 2,3-dioxygenase-like lactoylglutathione lyase family enzyme
MKTTRVFAVALMIALGAQGASAQPVNANRTAASIRVRYIVDDVPAAVAFYGKLGFKVDGQFGGTFAALSRGDVQLLLSPTKGPGGASQPMPNGQRPAPGGWNRIVLNTPDIQAEVARLRNEGVHFRNDIITGLGGKQILVDDPSGNPIELFQPD